MELLLTVLSGFVLAAFLPALHRRAGKATGWIAGALPAGLALLLLRHLPALADGATVHERYPWVASLGAEAGFRLDGLAMVFALLITVVGALIFVYAGAYLGRDERGRVLAWLSVFMGAMLGVVLADDLITLFVFWELTSLASYLLIGTYHEEGDARQAALQALLITGGGGLALLAGLLLLGNAGGSLALSDLLSRGAPIQASQVYPGIVVLVLAGALTKSAQVPFHIWLPSAMAAPAPISAYLHSATMVKAGIYLLLRLTPVLGGTMMWGLPLVAAGATTMVVGAYMALREADLKRILAYSTLSILGALTLSVGLGTPAAIKATVLLVVAHGLYKAALFMVAGNIDHGTGTRDLDQLGGLAKAMPITAAAAGLAAISLAGLGPLASFLGKELLFEAIFGAATARPLLLVAAALTAMMLVAVAGIVGIKPFLGPARATPRDPHEAPVAMLIGPMLLAGLGLLAGLLSPLLGTWLVSPAASAVLGVPTAAKLQLWHGVTPALLMSLVSVAGGALIYLEWHILHTPHPRLDALASWGPARWYTVGLDGLKRGARRLTDWIERASMLAHLQLALVTLLLVTVGSLLASLPTGRLFTGLDVSLAEASTALLIAGAALIVATTRSRLISIIALGVVGYAVALAFILFGAPDLAITQFLFETLAVLLFLAVLRRLPPYKLRAPRINRLGAASLALAVGIVVTLLLLAATGTTAPTTLADFYGDQSYLAAHGRNVVNVILVDFRSLDTLGEVVVLGTGGLGAWALIRTIRQEGDT